MIIIVFVNSLQINIELIAQIYHFELISKNDLVLWKVFDSFDIQFDDKKKLISRLVIWICNFRQKRKS